MDISTLVPSERIVEILSPATKAPLGIRVTIMHIDDPRIKTLKRKIKDENQRREQRGKIISAEMQEENTNEIAFALMTGWEWYNPTGMKGEKGYDSEREPKFEGKVPDFNKANVFAMFEKLPWFRAQIGEAVEETESFF